MLQLRKMGLDVQVFSLLPPLPSSTMHQQVQEMMPYVHYSPFLFSFKLILAQVSLFAPFSAQVYPCTVASDLADLAGAG